MRRLKLFFRILGVALVALGIMLLPLGYGVSPKRDTSRFHNLADVAAFANWGAVLLGVGVVLLALGFMLPGRSDD